MPQPAKVPGLKFRQQRLLKLLVPEKHRPPRVGADLSRRFVYSDLWFPLRKSAGASNEGLPWQAFIAGHSHSITGRSQPASTCHWPRPSSRGVNNSHSRKWTGQVVTGVPVEVLLLHGQQRRDIAQAVQRDSLEIF